MEYWDISDSCYLWTHYVWGYKTISTLKHLIILHYLENTWYTNINLPLWKDYIFPPVGNPQILQSSMLGLFSQDTYNYDFPHIIYTISDKQRVMHTGIFTSFLLIFVIHFFTFTKHDPIFCWHHYNDVIWIFTKNASNTTHFKFTKRHSCSLIFLNGHLFYIRKYLFSNF